jgi:hypothetical protein
MDNIVISAARHFEAEEDRNTGRCYAAAHKHGLTQEQADNCDDGNNQCPECPWPATQTETPTFYITDNPDDYDVDMDPAEGRRMAERVAGKLREMFPGITFEVGPDAMPVSIDNDTFWKIQNAINYHWDEWAFVDWTETPAALAQVPAEQASTPDIVLDWSELFDAADVDSPRFWF